MSQHLLARVDPISSCSVLITDVIDLYRKLHSLIKEAAEFEIPGLTAVTNLPNEQVENLKREIRNSYDITVRINGHNGEVLFGEAESIFSSRDLPDVIDSILMSSVIWYRTHRNNLNPINGFELTLDFTKPLLLDWRYPLSSATPNKSSLNVTGEKESWIAAVRSAVRDRLDARRNRRALLHKPFVYDAVVWLIAIPIGFIVCSKLSPFVEAPLRNMNPAVTIAGYVYLFFLTLVFFRVLFGYTKWAFPTVELTGSHNTAAKHRNFWYLIITGLVGTAIWQVWQLLF